MGAITHLPGPARRRGLVKASRSETTPRGDTREPRGHARSKRSGEPCARPWPRANNDPRDGQVGDTESACASATLRARTSRSTKHRQARRLGHLHAGRERPHDPKVGRPTGAGTGVVHALLSSPLVSARSFGGRQRAPSCQGRSTASVAFPPGNAGPSLLSRRVPRVRRRSRRFHPRPVRGRPTKPQVVPRRPGGPTPIGRGESRQTDVSFAQSYEYCYFMYMKGAEPNAREFVVGLARSGRHLFTTAEARDALGVSSGAAKVALHRLAQQGLISSPARGYYVVVPPEYRSLGCLPAGQFVPELMGRLGLRYYVGLLSAAQYHGAAHHRPQELQVFLERARRPLTCGRVRVAFIVRKRLRDVPVESLNTPRGAVRVSTPEATALDLIGYQRRAGGLNQVATVIAELSERLDGGKLVAVAATAPPAWSQRLGFLLERVGAAEKAGPLKAWVRTNARKVAVLLPDAEHGDAGRDAEWKLRINATVESEL